MADYSWIGPVVQALAAYAGSGMNGGTQDPALAQSMNDLFNYEKRKILMSDPGAAGTLGMQAPGGAVPMQQAVMQAAYKMLPAFARAGLGSMEVPLSAGQGTSRPRPTGGSTATPRGGGAANQALSLGMTAASPAVKALTTHAATGTRVGQLGANYVPTTGAQTGVGAINDMNAAAAPAGDTESALAKFLGLFGGGSNTGKDWASQQLLNEFLASYGTINPTERLRRDKVSPLSPSPTPMGTQL